MHLSSCVFLLFSFSNLISYCVYHLLWRWYCGQKVSVASAWNLSVVNLEELFSFVRHWIWKAIYCEWSLNIKSGNRRLGNPSIPSRFFVVPHGYGVCNILYVTWLVYCAGCLGIVWRQLLLLPPSFSSSPLLLLLLVHSALMFIFIIAFALAEPQLLVCWSNMCMCVHECHIESTSFFPKQMNRGCSAGKSSRNCKRFPSGPNHFHCNETILPAFVFVWQ